MNRLNGRIEEKVFISVHPDVDMMVTQTERGEYELRTPTNHQHVAAMVAAECAIRQGGVTRNYWPFLRCLME